MYDFEVLGNSEEKKVIVKNDGLFQYMYFVIMLNTELHNVNLLEKPTLQKVVDRIKVVNKPLAQE